MTAIGLRRDQSESGGLLASIKSAVSAMAGASRSADAEANPPHDVTGKFCIVGAGPSGLAAAKNLKQAGIAFDCFEANGDVGGMWNPASPNRAYATVHLNISKRLMQFNDFAISAAWPDFLGPALAFSYLKAYAKRFGIYDAISFNTAVRKAEKSNGQWLVWTGDDEAPRTYRGLIVANGHHWDPRLPDGVSLSDDGIIHAQSYKSPDQLRGKKVLVVGAGNSGLDIACDAAHHAAECHHSLRRGYHIIPKLIFGRPADRMLERLKQMRLSRAVTQRIAEAIVRLHVGPYEKYGLPRPSVAMFSEHPAASSQYLELRRHGEIAVRPDIAETHGHKVKFVDGAEETFDLIIYCTGYRVSMPFLDPTLCADTQDRSKLFLNLFHRGDDSLFFVGLFQPADGGFWQLADYQAMLMARYIKARDGGAKAARRFRAFVEAGDCDVGRCGTAADLSDRNLYAVDHYRYRKAVARLMRRLGSIPT
jgi:cation diffusion facilitator CzcD-associated flavoprotein CzcO